MNITKEQIDALNAVVTVGITKEDYSDKIQKKLQDYRKNVNISGFRKGTVPMSLIQKKYGKAILLEEVNEILKKSLTTYLIEEKIDVFGNPLPRVSEDFNWDAEDFAFEFELGLVPSFEIDLTAENKLIKYNIIADDSMINEEVEHIQRKYGKLVCKDTVEEGDYLRGVFRNEEKKIDNDIIIFLKVFKEKETAKKFIGKKVGDVVTLKTKGLFEDDNDLIRYLDVSYEDIHDLDVEVDFTIKEINETELAEINQELFDKLFGEGNLTSVEQLKEKIKEDFEKEFSTEANQKFLNDVTEFLLETTKFDLPAEFLKKWIKTISETPITPEEVEEEYVKFGNALRYNLIKSKVIADNNLEVTLEDLKSYAGGVIKKQMTKFGQMNPTEEAIEGIVSRVLSIKEEVERVSDCVISEKMTILFNKKVKAKNKEVTYKEFIEESYSK